MRDFDIRASAIQKWIQCPRYARRHVEGESRHVAAVVGTLVHAHLAGQDNAELPGVVRYDSITRDLREARSQASDMARDIERLLEEQKIVITETEVELESRMLRMTGHVDALARDVVGARLAIDFKTGRLLGAAWLQLGAYAAMLREREIPVESVAVVQRMRRVVYGSAPCTIEYRSARDVEVAFHAWHREVADMASRGTTHAMHPGDHCRFCSLVCPVRV